MATIVKTSMGGPLPRPLTEVVLTATNVLVYEPGTGQVLILRNPTGASVSPVIDGADGTTVSYPTNPIVSVAAGFPVGAIPAGGVVAVKLDQISDYLQGAINVTGTGLVAILLGT